MTQSIIKADDVTNKITTDKPLNRKCGDCQLCCKLLPIDDGRIVDGVKYVAFAKEANHRCKHQRTGKGCAIYPRRPVSCQLWQCRWLADDDTADLRRPDRMHFVIDVVPDFIRITVGDKTEEFNVVQVWCDPDYPDAWRAPNMMDYMERRARENILTLVRYNAEDAIVVFAPSMSSTGQWHFLNSKNNPQMRAEKRLEHYGMSNATPRQP